MNFIKKISNEELSICENAGTFLQSAMWGEFKSRFGWEAKAFIVEWDSGASESLLVLSRRLLPGFVFAYIPWGPQLPADFTADGRHLALAEFARKLKPFLARNTAFIRFDPPWFFSHSDDYTGTFEKETLSLAAAGLKCAAATVQPPDTVHINLDAPCEQILAAMKPKWRYNISLAGKKGVQVNVGGVQDMETFYSLLKETAVRDGIAIHSINYYKTLFEICGSRSKGTGDSTLRLYTASHEGDTLAAIVVLFRRKIATYLYGASSNTKRNLMAAYALQWKAMQDAKEDGCQCYDLFGIPPDDDPSHPMAGLYRFKTGFGGQIIHRPGSWDYRYKPVIYSLFNAAEALRKKLRDRRKKR